MFTVFAFLLTLLPVSLAAPHGPALQTNTQRTSTPQTTTSQPLNLTTLAANNRSESIIQCWSIAELQISDSPGIKGALVALLPTPGALSYFSMPAGLDGGLHNAPVVQFVWLTSGKAVFSLPKSNDTATVQGGANGLILATDIAAVSKLGHTTVYPSKKRTVGMAIPLANNTVPEHTVLHAGPCTAEEGPDLFE